MFIGDTEKMSTHLTKVVGWFSAETLLFQLLYYLERLGWGQNQEI